jgi:hypothetical protein
MEKSLLLFWLLRNVNTASWAPVGETEMHVSCGEKSRGDWRSGKGHAAHLECNIISITQVTGGGVLTLIPCRCLKT